MNRDPAETIILSLLADRPSISPTEAARALAGPEAGEAWQQSLSPIRLAAMRLARAGEIEFLRKGKPVAWDAARGVLRMRLTPR